VECRAALSLAPRDSFVLLAVGTSLSQQDKRKEAAAVYKQALALDPSLVLGHVLLANALIGAGPEYRDEGLVEGMAALRLDPNSKEAMMLFGFLFTDAGASDHDIATLRSEANAHANDPASRFVLGLALQAADKEKAAIAFLEARKRDTENDTSRKPNGYRVREAKEGLLNGIVHMIEKDTSSFAIVKGDTQAPGDL